MKSYYSHEYPIWEGKMKRVMLLLAILAMVLAAAAPAFGQALAVDEGDDVEYNAVCQNILGQIDDINAGNFAEQDVVATDDSAAAADLAQSSGVSIEQVNECLNVADFDADGFVTIVELKEFGVVVVTAAKAQYGGGGGGGGGGTLPETGGAPLLALGAGAFLVAGGLMARRIFR